MQVAVGFPQHGCVFPILCTGNLRDTGSAGALLMGPTPTGFSEDARHKW